MRSDGCAEGEQIGSRRHARQGKCEIEFVRGKPAPLFHQLAPEHADGDVATAEGCVADAEENPRQK